MPLSTTISNDRVNVAADGAWTSDEAAALEPQIETLLGLARHPCAIARSARAKRDRHFWRLPARKADAQSGAKPGGSRSAACRQRFRGLMAEVERVETSPMPRSGGGSNSLFSSRSAARIFAAFAYIVTFTDMLGAVVTALLRVIANPRRLRFTSLVSQLDRVGLQAVPIILLITFLIGGDHRAAGHLPFPQIRRRELCRRSGRHIWCCAKSAC